MPRIRARPLHPRLVHGFLVKIGARRSASSQAPIPGAEGLAAIVAQATPMGVPAPEGPTDDATFH